ncbi:viroplasmin family protein [Succinatimonas hippei]|uniref:ribonuclease H1 domain-containing protein n=1 Tax=Succinatimonas hippei TaxID=626938 RepID=UPI0023F74994|nr:viroplasmin family protein [Succinatimonas hippei]
MKYYAVRKGNNTGIFNTWDECKASIYKYPQADYKSFHTKEEAEAYLSGKDLWSEKIANDLNNGYAVAFTDGSFDKERKKYSYGVVIVTDPNNLHEYELSGNGSNEKFIDTANIIGEIFGVINAMDWAISHEFSKLKIYHDYEGVSKWLRGEWQANSSASKMYCSLYEKKFKNILNVEFEKVKGHSNNKYNDHADRLAASALSGVAIIKNDNNNPYFVVNNLTEYDFSALHQLLKNELTECKFIEKKQSNDKVIISCQYNHEKLALTYFKRTGTLLVQGRRTSLMQLILSLFTEFLRESEIKDIFSSVYKKTIDQYKINDQCKDLGINVCEDTISKLLKAAVINLNYYVETTDYSFYAIPALRALELYMKELLNQQGIHIDKTTGFNCFERNAHNQKYICKSSVRKNKQKLEDCYNFYKKQRDTLAHAGDWIGTTDNTRIISKKHEVDEIIKKCISLICIE